MEQHVFTAGVGSNLEELPKIIPHKKFSSPPTPPPPQISAFSQRMRLRGFWKERESKAAEVGVGQRWREGAGNHASAWLGRPERGW